MLYEEIKIPKQTVLTFRVKWNQENTDEGKGVKGSYYMSNGACPAQKRRNCVSVLVWKKVASTEQVDDTLGI